MFGFISSYLLASNNHTNELINQDLQTDTNLPPVSIWLNDPNGTYINQIWPGSPGSVGVNGSSKVTCINCSFINPNSEIIAFDNANLTLINCTVFKVMAWNNSIVEIQENLDSDLLISTYANEMYVGHTATLIYNDVNQMNIQAINALGSSSIKVENDTKFLNTTIIYSTEEATVLINESQIIELSTLDDSINASMKIYDSSLQFLGIFGTNLNLTIDNSTISEDLRLEGNLRMTINNSLIKGQEYTNNSDNNLQYINESTINGLFWINNGYYYFNNTSIDNGGFLWINDYDAKGRNFNANATLFHSNCSELRLNHEGSVVINESIINDASFFEESRGDISNSAIKSLLITENSHVNISDSVIEEYSIASPNVLLNDCIIIDAAPQLVPLPSVITNSSQLILNWTESPGENFTGRIKNYTIYRALVNISDPDPLISDYTIVNYTSFPILPDNTTWYDPDIEENVTEGKHIFYKVEIMDEGNNKANSTVVQTIRRKIAGKLEANIFLTGNHTTYEMTTIDIQLTNIDVNEDGSPDVNTSEIRIYLTIHWGGGGTAPVIITPFEIIEYFHYQFNLTAFPQADKITGYVIINATEEFDGYDVSFNSSERGLIFELNRPNIDTSPVFLSTDDSKIIETDVFEVNISIFYGINYVQNVTIKYSFDEGPWVYNCCNWDGLYTYSYEFTTLTEIGYGELNFTIIIYDIANLTVREFESFILTIYPQFPIVSLDTVAIVTIILCSGIVGAVIGITHLQAKKTSNTKSEEFLNSLKLKLSTEAKASKQVQEETFLMPQKISRDLFLDSGTQVENLNKMLYGGLAGLIAGTTIALVISYGFDTIFHHGFYDIATLILLGMIFVALYVYVVWLYKDSTLDTREENLHVGRSIVGYLNAFIILGITILMLEVGANIPWFRYYIVEQSGTEPIEILGLSLPYSYIKVASAALSSLVAFSLSVYFDIRKNIKDIQVYEKRNANISSIIYMKEEFINKTNGRINIKILVFLVLLGFALIPYSDEGFMNIVPLGLLLIVPCALVFCIFFLIGFIGQYNQVSKPFLLEPIKKCGQCGTDNINSAIFCRNCKAEIAKDQMLYGKTITCKYCDSINPIGSKFCSDCGKDLF